MATLNFDPDNTLAGGLFGLTPKEVIRLGIDLCAAVERAVGADGCHGGIWPGNITWTNGQVAVGPINRDSITDMSPDLLEFVSPEQFWSGSSSPASDVYSIGLVLYTALNRGVMPYFQKAEDHSPEERAEALQNRMKGVALSYPSAAGRALGDTVLKAAAFRPEERYATPGQLKAALESLPEGSDVPAAVPVVPLTEKEKQNAPSYRVDKDFEDTVPVKKTGRRGRKTGVPASRLAALGLAPEDGESKTEHVMRTLVSGHPAEDTPTSAPAENKAAAPPDNPDKASVPAPVPVPEPPPEPSPSDPPPKKPKKQKKEAGEVDEDIGVEEFREAKPRGRWIFPLLLVAVIVVALIFLLRGCRDDGGPNSADPPVTTSPVNMIHSPVPETAAPWQDMTEETPPAETPPAETDAPPETEPPEESPAVTDEPEQPRYELVMADVSWTRARTLAEQAGGHLVTARSAEQLREIIALAEENGAQFVWLGASRSTADDNWYYVTGEPMDYADWDRGEPTGTGSDGTREDYLLLWYRPAVRYWSYNDTINDPVSYLPRTYSGKICYIIEYDR